MVSAFTIATPKRMFRVSTVHARLFSLLSLLVVAIVVLTGARSMHLHLEASVPAADSRVTSAPRQILLRFSSHPEVALARVQLLGPDSAVVATGKPTEAADSLTLAVPVRGKLGPGRYTVRWRAAGRDGHPAMGEFVFAVREEPQQQSAPNSTSRDHSTNQS